MKSIDLKFFTTMATFESRREAARRMAEDCGATDLFIFDFDEEVQRFLPSPGFHQTIANGQAWRRFLGQCASEGQADGLLPCPPSQTVRKVFGKAFSAKLIWVFDTEELSPSCDIVDWALLDASLAIIFSGERRAKKQDSQNQILRELTSDLRTYANALNQAKSDLNKALQEKEVAKQNAEQANITKSAFLANMSHEIRTPLGVILGYSSLLKDHSLPIAEREQFVETIDRNGQTLVRIIDDILDLAKVEAGKLAVEEVEFSLKDLVQDVIGLFQDVVAQKSIAIKYTYASGIPTFVSSDPTRIRQILINIIGNAVKFTGFGSVTVRVSGKSVAEKEFGYIVEVEDTGTGLSSEQKDRLFQPFMQADNSITRQFGGTGLGLILSRRLAEALGGTLQLASSHPGKGSTFVIRFVAKVIPEINPLTIPIAPVHPQLLKSLEGFRILLVDDAADNLVLAKRMLTKSGAEVEAVSDGTSAVEKALNVAYDVILMDIQMPGMDGYQALSLLRSNNYKGPVIALTAHAMIEDRLKSYEAGFDDHLTKPVDFTNLVQTVKSLIDKPRSLRSSI